MLYESFQNFGTRTTVSSLVIHKKKKKKKKKKANWILNTVLFGSPHEFIPVITLCCVYACGVWVLVALVLTWVFTLVHFLHQIILKGCWGVKPPKEEDYSL